MGWFSRWLLVVRLFMILTRVTSVGVKVVSGKRNMAIYGHSFVNYTGMEMNGCTAKCLDNCLCSSFQICDGKCQLCDSNRHKDPGAYRETKKCSNFEITDQVQCSDTCTIDINCCWKSNPCLNGGKCEPIVSSTTQFGRFRCKCARGYGGKRCEHKLLKSCRRWYYDTQQSGVYEISDNSDEGMQVWCDFNNDTRTAWTLVQSYEFGEKASFSEYPYYLDKPYNNQSPSWKKYRLSNDQMKSILDDSTKWRITCDYEKDGVDYTDYVTGSTAEVNILGVVDFKCVLVEYIDVRKHNCSNCSIIVVQTPQNIFHTDIYHNFNCDFTVGSQDGSLSCHGAGEDNFGLYLCANRLHRCSSNRGSTTQTWFGYKYNSQN